MSEPSIPDYEPLLASYHRAFAAELESMVATLPIRDGDRILELACGDGAYTKWLTKRVGATGSVVALDLLIGYLQEARGESAGTPGSSRTQFVAASIERLPFGEGTFDLAWCAQSLFSLPEPVSSVQRMARVVRPGGVVAVLEDDTMHQLLLPWPVDLELAIRQAEWEAFVEESDHPGKFYVGRRLVGVFRKAGLVDVEVRTFATNRLAPLDRDCRGFVVADLKDLEERVGPRLSPEHRKTFDRLVRPSSAEFLPDQPDLALTVIDHVVQGRKPD